jgi:hypothetical protein
MQAVFDHSQSQHSSRLVLLAIADGCDHTGAGCWSGKKRLAEMANVDRATVTRSIITLCEMGELAVEERPGRTNLYRILLPVDNPVRGAQYAPGKGAQLAPPGAQDAPTPRDEMRPEPSSYPSLIPKDEPDEFSTADPETAQAAIDRARAVVESKPRPVSHLFAKDTDDSRDRHPSALFHAAQGQAEFEALIDELDPDRDEPPPTRRDLE